MIKLLISVLVIYTFHVAFSESANISTTPKPRMIAVPPQTTCKDCTSMKFSQCLWCSSKTPSCIKFSGSIPSSKVCSLNDAKYFSCSINVLVLIICMVCAGILIILMTICCIYCCCCRSGGSRMRRRLAKEEAREDRQRSERLAANAEKKAEREKKRDEIRTKYGLKKNDVPYTRFDE